MTSRTSRSKKTPVELLGKNPLRRKVKKCMIGTGSMTDPYIPLELETGNLRRAILLIYKYGFGFTLINESPLMCCATWSC